MKSFICLLSVLCILIGTVTQAHPMRRKKQSQKVASHKKNSKPQNSESQQEPATVTDYIKNLDMINVIVSTSDEREYALLLASDMNGSDIKKLISNKWGYAANKQRLILTDKNQTNNDIINNTETVESISKKTGGKSPIKLKLTIIEPQNNQENK